MQVARDEESSNMRELFLDLLFTQIEMKGERRKGWGRVKLEDSRKTYYEKHYI